jgi:hypothetical protein
MVAMMAASPLSSRVVGGADIPHVRAQLHSRRARRKLRVVGSPLQSVGRDRLRGCGVTYSSAGWLPSVLACLSGSLIRVRAEDDSLTAKRGEFEEMATVQVRYIVNDVDVAIAFYTKHLEFSCRRFCWYW